MATAINDITGNQLKTMPSKAYEEKYDSIDWSVKLITEEPLCSQCGELECECDK